MNEEPSLMTSEVLLSRMRDFSLTGISQVAGLIMGGVFATAAVTFTEILRTQEALPERLAGWLFGVTASLMALDGLIRRALIEARPILHAVPMVGLAGLLSMVAFALLGPLTGGHDGWRYSNLLVVIVGVLFQRSFGSSVAEHVEPALQPLYERIQSRSRRRLRQVLILVTLSLVPFVMAMIEQFAGVALQWPIALTNLVLCGLCVFSMMHSIRYYAAINVEAYAAHVEKVAQQAPEARPRRRKAAADPPV